MPITDKNNVSDMPIIPVIPNIPKSHTTERKIGRTTFIVSSSFNEKGKGDIVSKIARLIENDPKRA